jgi:CRISPR/Cas system-associated endonuclease Cas1
MTPTEHFSPIVKQRQVAATHSLKIKLAAWLLCEKIKNQSETVQAVNPKAGLSRNFQRHEKALKACKTIAAMREVESHSARVYWGAFDGIPLNLKGLGSKPIPDHWLTITNRISPKSGSGRDSINPFHSCLNYLYACLESRVKRHCISHRLDVDFPVLHSNSRTNRHGPLTRP